MPDLADVPGITELWASTTGDPRVRVALIDGPVDRSFPCFDGAELVQLHTGWLDGADVADDKGAEHGTWVASVLFGQHTSATPGLAPGCTGLLVPSLRVEAHHVDPVNLARSIEAAVGAGAHVIVIEQCLPSKSGDVDALVRSAVSHAEAEGVLVIAAAGNNRGECSCHPAAIPEVLAVGAHDDDGNVYDFSNWGPQYLPNAIVAPGGNMPGASIMDDSGITRHKGTSCSAPLVGGVAALLLSLQLRDGGEPDPLAVRTALLSSAIPCAAQETDGAPDRCLAGKLDVAAATRTVHNGRTAGAAVTSTTTVTLSGPRRSGLVFALGTVGYDFGTEARRDTFKQLMAPVSIPDSSGVAVPANPYDARQMADHLTAHPPEARSLIWTLNLELTPVYAVEPVGPFAAEVYQALVRLLHGELAAEEDPGYVERVSIPGRLADRTVRLFSGQVVPVVEIDQLRGMYGWQVNALLDAAVAVVPELPENVTEHDIRKSLREFLTRVYYDLRNLGTTSKDRALNFAATNAFQAVNTVAEAVATGRALDTVGVEKSPFCRMNSDCWDVKLRFFDPDNGRRARKVYRFTIDVSDTLPVTLGSVRTWSESGTGTG